MLKWFGLGDNECFVVGIGLVLFVVRVRVELGTDLGGLRFLLLLYIENMDIETFVLSKDLASLKSVRLLISECLRFLPRCSIHLSIRRSTK